MAEHIDRSLGLFQNNVPDERFIDPILGLHIEKKNLAVDRVKALHRNLDRSADLALDRLSSCRLAVNVSDCRQLPEAIFPGSRQNHVSGPGIDESIASQNISFFEQVPDSHLDGYASHVSPRLLPLHTTPHHQPKSHLPLPNADQCTAQTCQRQVSEDQSLQEHGGWHIIECLKEVLTGPIALLTMTPESQMTATDVARRIDHTLLRAETTQVEILRLCEEAVTHGFHAVCVNPRWVSAAADRLQGNDVSIAAVVSFPLGADTTKVKVAQVQDAIYAGADEIDMVADLAAIIEGDAQYLLHQLMSVLRACRTVRPAVLLKVIIESAALTTDQKVFACRIAEQAGIDFLKTSTGFHPAGGATVEDVVLMKQTAPKCKIKASGGIKTAEQAMAMLHAGADRIGTSSGIAIVEGLRTDGGAIRQ